MINDHGESACNMERLTISKFGPVTACDIVLKDFLIFTGAQATGKSTIAKSIFFFSNLKKLLLDIIMRGNQSVQTETISLSLYTRFVKAARNNFLQIFGTTWAMDPDMELCYSYHNGETISVSLTKDKNQNQFAYISISQGMKEAISALSKRFDHAAPGIYDQGEIRKLVYQDIFGNGREVVYIPAGRSLITLLSSQINYIYSTMDDNQKRTLDYCTTDYLERILRIKPFLVRSPEELIQDEISNTDRKLDRKLLNKAAGLMHAILKGTYRNIAGEERLQIKKDQYVKINYASSGQQEALWILNVLFYYMLNRIPARFIIEEPESHLYPDAQKLITEMITLTMNEGSQVVMTTHSPYVLGSINNLLFAHHIAPRVDKAELEKIADPFCWLDFKEMDAFYLKDGRAIGCSDPDHENIQNDIIDGASEAINTSYEDMIKLLYRSSRTEEP